MSLTHTVWLNLPSLPETALFCTEIDSVPEKPLQDYFWAFLPVFRLSEHPDYDKDDIDWEEKLEDYLNSDKEYYTYEEFNNYDYIEYETFEDSYDGVVAFGYYGMDM